MASERHEWDAPLAHLRSIPFIRELDFDSARKTIDLTTPRGRHRLSVEVKRSYLDRTLVNAILSHAPERSSGKRRATNPTGSRFVLARYIPAAVGEQFIAAGISFADEPGNVHVELGEDYNWTVLGKREPPRPADAARTTPATVQLLFQLASAPQSATWTVRDLARAAGISKTKIALLLNQFRRERLLDGKSEFQITPEIIDRLVAGYGRTLRPKLVIGRYRPPEPSIDPFLERLSQEASTQKLRYALTGGPGADAMQHFYRGPEAPVFLAQADTAVLRVLRLLPDRTGPVVLLRPFGELVYWREFDGAMVAPPWLMYAELLVSSDPRAREAAEELRREFLQ
ncbi:MAG: type IV toxin-antitoxin system AbiEi family antitoxin [Candidatus Solibacter sp.]